MALLPDPDDLARPFWAAAREQRLVMQRCSACGRWRFPPRPMCPACRSLAVEWVPVSGKGTIWSFITCHPPLLPDLAAQAPFVVVIVELAESPELRMVGNLLPAGSSAINVTRAADITIGDPVEVTFVEASEDVVLPQWIEVRSPGSRVEGPAAR